MASYKKIREYAIEQYAKLPQEGSELYANHFVNIPFKLEDYLGAKADAGAEKQALEALLAGELKDLGIRFDAVFGSDVYFSNSSSFVKIKSAEDLSEKDVKMRMHDSSEDKYMAFIDAYAKSAVFIDIPDKKDAKLNLLFSNSNKPLNVQVMISVGRGSKLQLSELYCSRSAKVSSNGVMHEVRTGSGSAIEINSLHNENATTVVLGFCKAVVGEESTFCFNSLYNGGSHVRARTTASADKPKGVIRINEIALGAGEQKFDLHTLIKNSERETDASLTSKAVLMDNSLCMLKGFAKVEKGAIKSRSYVHQRGMALDKGAKMYELPDMSVDENDVKATHSSAMSPIDAEAMFYLMSKGIDEREVRKLIVTGFFADGLSRIEDYTAREIAMSLIREKLRDKTFGKIPKLDTADMWIARGRSPKGDMLEDHYKYEKQ